MALELMIKPMYGIHDMDSVLSRRAWPLPLCGLLASKFFKLYLLIWYLKGQTKTPCGGLITLDPFHPQRNSDLSFLKQTL